MRCVEQDGLKGLKPSTRMFKTIEISQAFSHVQESFQAAFPKTSKSFDISQSEKVFSSFQIHLPSKVLTQVQAFVKGFYHLKTNSDYQNRVLNPDITKPPSPTPSVLCCFDFHYHPDSEELKLIEINTNASAYVMGMLSFNSQGLNTQSFEDSLIQSFKHTFTDTDIAIIDTQPEQQKMYLEFLLYQELFSQHGWDIEIYDTSYFDKNLGSLNIKSIYNRDTDFYLKNFPAIKKAYQSGQVTLSPHPFDYDLMAKKTNLDLLSQSKPSDFSDLNTNLDINLGALQSHLLPSGLVQKSFASLEELTAQRKKYFFKPATAFGGKSIYKGASVSKKYLKEIWDNNLLYQENFPAGQFIDSHEQKWKFDLRFYTFEGQVQFYLARVFQGQITNFKTNGGGFAPVVFA